MLIGARDATWYRAAIFLLHTEKTFFLLEKVMAPLDVST